MIEEANAPAPPTTVRMFDAVTPSRIPNHELVEAVLVYIDGRYAWSGADLALFPKAQKVRIACLPTTDDGSVLDVEKGDATPADIPRWLEMRRTSKAHPIERPATIYTSYSNWQTCKQAVLAARIDPPHWLIADWTDKPEIIAGSIGTQFLSTPGYDESIVEASWL